MNIIKKLFCTAIIFLPFLLPAQQSNRNAAPVDTIISLAAAEQNLERVPASAWPATGTFWLVSSNGQRVPLPMAPTDTTMAVYEIADGIFLVDGTKGQVAVPHGGTMTEAVNTQANAVMDFIAEMQTAAWERMLVKLLGGEEAQDPNRFTDTTTVADTNGLWLEITNVFHGRADLNLHHATNWVYALWSTPDLLSGWQVETELWPTDTNSFSFHLAAAGRPNLFLRAQDWTDVDSRGAGVPDWWQWYWFGQLTGAATNVDDLGNTFWFDFVMGLSPNVIDFTLTVTNDYSRQINAPLTTEIIYGQPSYYAVLVDDTNYLHAVWRNYTSSNLTANLGLDEGWHEVRVGLRGHGDWKDQGVWQFIRLNLDYTPPRLVVTNPAPVNASATVIKPYLQLQGFANEPLMSLSYDISNASGVITGQPCEVTDQLFSPNADDFTTNYFHAYDVPLALANNQITLRVADRAGNVTTTNFNVVLDYTTATNPPVVKMVWPLDGMTVCGTNLTLRGKMSDETGTIQATVRDATGAVQATVDGLVERNGDFWIENVPVNGTMQISIQGTDAAGNVTTTGLTVEASDLILTIDATPTGDALWEPTGNVSGQISDHTAKVFVNGIEGVNHHDGTWSATNVPVYGKGTAVFDVSVVTYGIIIPDGSTSGQQTISNGTAQASVNLERPARVIVSFHEYTGEFFEMTMTGPYEGDLNSKLVGNDKVTAYKADLTVATNGGWQHNYHGIYDATWGNPPPEKLHVEWDQNGVSPTNERPPPIPFEDYVTWQGAAVVHYEGWDWFWYDHPPGTDGKFQRDMVKASAHTELKLYSGGRSQVGGQSLIRLKVENAQYYLPSPEDSDYEYPWFNASIIPITNWSGAWLKTQRVGPGGIAWKMMPENDHAVVTFQCGYKHYSADVVPTKYKANIILTTSTTNADLATDVPEVCVGQKVTFALTNLPMSQVKNMVGGWTLPKKFVNEKWQHQVRIFDVTGNGRPDYWVSYGSTNYRANPDLLRDTNNISCWYINGHGGHVSVGLNIQFTNGQNVSLAANGDFKVYRPTVTNFNVLSAGTPTCNDGASWLGMNIFGMLELSAVHFEATIQCTNFSGSANWRQLDNRWVFTSNPVDYLWQGTQGDYWLDNSEFYNTTGADGDPSAPIDNTPVGPNLSKPVALWDNPGVGYRVSVTSVSDSFKTYLIFKPEPDSADDIWVPLGRADWGWSADASVNFLGIGGASLIRSSTNSPVFSHTDEFPEWISILHNK